MMKGKGFFSHLDNSEDVQVPSQQNIEPPTQKKEGGFFAHLEEEPSRAKSISSAFPKGFIKGGAAVESLRDPITAFIKGFGKDVEGQLAEKLLPTQKGQFLENVLETAGELTPSFAIGPGGIGAKAAQVGAGALTKNVLKEMGAPELAQDIGAGIGSIIPQGIKGALSKKLIPSPAQKQVYDLLKSNGISDEKIVPFIQNKSKANILSKWTKGFINKEKLSDEAKSVSKMIYGSIDEKGSSLPPLEGLRKQAFVKLFNEELKDLPYYLRDQVKKDVHYLNNSNLGWKDLRDVEKSINNRIKGIEGGKAQIGKLKEALNKGQFWISPELFKEKETMNKAFSSHKNLLKGLSQDSLDKLLSKGEIGAIAVGILSGNPISKGLLIKKGAQFGLSKFLTSPRFQGIQRKLLSSIKKNNEGAMINMVTKALEDLNKYVKEEPETEE